ncbi:MAG: hypothetical protein ABJF86_08830 [Tateyamaria sp.]|uniref:hypothetical protein n=1 Tax=Tateyamaria sp. TaxID=1929288 RepID=UPI0032908D30
MQIHKGNRQLGDVSATIANDCANICGQEGGAMKMCGNLAIPNHFLATVRRQFMGDSHLSIDSTGQKLDNDGK